MLNLYLKYGTFSHRILSNLVQMALAVFDIAALVVSAYNDNSTPAQPLLRL